MDKKFKNWKKCAKRNRLGRKQWWNINEVKK